METILFSFIIGACLFYIAQPYFKSQEGRSFGKKMSRGQILLADLETQRDTILASIKDLELDREMGKVSDDDYSQMNALFRHDAVGVLQQIDAMNGSSSGKAAKRKAVETELKSLQDSKKSQAKLTCHQCGNTVAIDDLFCNHCGTEV